MLHYKVGIKLRKVNKLETDGGEMGAKWNILGGSDGRLTLMLGCWEQPCRSVLGLSELGFGALGLEVDAGVGFYLVIPLCSMWRPLVGENEVLLKVMGERFWLFSLLYAFYDQFTSLICAHR